MSAAATAAGYLYASGRLRGRNGRDNEHHDNEHHRDNDRHYDGGERALEAKRPAVKVAVYRPEMQAPQTAAPQAPAPPAKKTPRIEYRTRRWRPE
jgi:hypothetical protein